VAELGYTGQISFDFLVTDDGLTFVECNPRATDQFSPTKQWIAAGSVADPSLASGTQTAVTSR
jgi:hypothetical protein